MKSLTYYQLNCYKEFSNISPNVVLVYSIIRNECEESNEVDEIGKYAIIRVKKISAHSRLSERTVQRALRELVGLKLISIDDEVSILGCKFRINIIENLTPLYDDEVGLKTPVVYFFKDEYGNTIYIGKTIDINGRMCNHNHLPDDCYNSIKTIEYIEIGNVSDMDFIERNLIMKLKPKYNTEFKDGSTTIDIDISKYKLNTFDNVSLLYKHNKVA